MSKSVGRVLRSASAGTVVLDVDGVLLDYEGAVSRFCHDHGYKQPATNEMYKEFSTSEYAITMRPMVGAVRAVRKMYENGLCLIICTAFGVNAEMQAGRIKNLKQFFGNDTFDHFIFAPWGQTTKSAELNKFWNDNPRPFTFIDDSINQITDVLEDAEGVREGILASEDVPFSKIMNIGDNKFSKCKTACHVTTDWDEILQRVI